MKIFFLAILISISLFGGQAVSEVSSIVLSEKGLKELKTEAPFAASKTVVGVETALKKLANPNDTNTIPKNAGAGVDYYQIFDGYEIQMFGLIRDGKVVEKSWDQLSNDEKLNMFDDGTAYSIYREDSFDTKLGIEAASVSVKKGDYVVQILRARTWDMPCKADNGERVGKLVIGSGVLIDIDLKVVRGKVGLTLGDIADAFGFGWRKVRGDINTRTIGLPEMPIVNSMASNASGTLSEETVSKASEVATLYANSIDFTDIPPPPKVLMIVDHKAPGIVRERFIENRCNLPKPGQ